MSAMPETAAETTPEAQPTVLVVDDVPYLLELASIFLARTARIVTAGNGQDGLDAAWREKPDLILCDDRMPGLSGADLCRRVRQDADLRSTPFIMLVSDPGGAARGAAIRAGANDVLTKPLSRLSLVEAVSRFLATTRTRGLPRITTDVPVTVTHGEDEMVGVVRNVSRGGAYVETEGPLACADEVGLRFRLPESPVVIAPSAEVMWCRNRFESRGTADGVGLRFVELDGASVRTLDEFVYEHASVTPEGVAP